MPDKLEDFLAHYGVPGMRWGKRKVPGKPMSAEGRRVRELRKHSVDKHTNKQIKFHNERMGLEQSYNRLNPGKRAQGEMAVKGLLATVGIGVSAYNLLNSPAGKAAMSKASVFTNRKGYPKPPDITPAAFKWPAP